MRLWITAQGDDKSSATVQKLSLAYDDVNDILSVTDLGASANKDNPQPSLSQSFTYDADYRLLTANGAYGTQTFSYDADGNRLHETSTVDKKTSASAYTYPTTSNQLEKITGAVDRAFTWTANGDLATETGDRDKAFAYDARNRNSALATRDEAGEGGVTYTYNALGERVSKSDAESGFTRFLYDEQGHLIAEADGFGGISKEYIYMGSP